MAADGVFLHLVKEEISAYIGTRVQKIYQPMRDTLILSLASRDASGRLLICTGADSARIHMTDTPAENPAVPPMFCMLMRKHLTGAQLKSIEQLGMDRVLLLGFDAVNEMGDRTDIIIAVELLGGQSNILLCRREESGLRIIDCLRRTDAEAKRLLLPGAAYEPPAPRGGMNILTEEPVMVADAVMSAGGVSETALRSVLDGFSPLAARELCHRCGEHADKAAAAEEIGRFRDMIERGSTPCMAYDADGNIIAYTYFEPRQYGSGITVKTYGTYSGLLDSYYAERDARRKQRELTSSLGSAVSKLCARAERKTRAREADLEKSRGRELLRRYGELIYANAANISAGAPFVDAEDYYDNMKPVRIPLDPALSAAANAQKYFREYKKAAAAEKVLGSLISQSREEYEYLRSVADALSRADSFSDVNDIKEELISQGYIKPVQGRARMKQKPSGPLEFVTDDGLRVLVGRNNRQNDELTLRRAAAGDIWLHVKDAPGSHVILVTGGAEPAPLSLEQAAVIAGTYSSAAMSENVPVDYTAVKNVKKPSGAAPGRVIYRGNKTLYVTPSKELCDRLAAK